MKEIPSFSNYKITEDGTVLSKRKGYRKPVTNTWIPEENWKPIKPVLDKGIGYLLVTLISYTEKGVRIKKNQFIHRLLAQAYIPNPENKAHVNHKDGVKTNNSLDNLEWATEQENSQHAVNNNLTTYEHCEVSIEQFTRNNVFLQEFKSLHEAERITGVAFQNIYKVAKGKRHSAGGFIWKYKANVQRLSSDEE